jgi:hypothetical protein
MLAVRIPAIVADAAIVVLGGLAVLEAVMTFLQSGKAYRD